MGFARASVISNIMINILEYSPFGCDVGEGLV